MFGRIRKEIEEFKEQTTRQLVTLDDKVQSLVDDASKEDVGSTDADLLKVAYALNLCSVSVSQIIDYNDLNILEQEYEAILNNINIEHMPDDESLLHILRQLLDTITFFRLQEGDRRIAQLEYQHKVKNAIWSAVPNIGLIVATANPVAMAVSLASQVGIGYMNYRRQKATIDLERQKSEWQLQRSAMEQFNVLRRELFDTAWKISKKYGFPDEYRLTERQINHYDKILMEPDIFKKEVLMKAMKDEFIAYPPFWYHWGHNAYMIAQASERGSAREAEYLGRTRERFEHFERCNVYPLLRTDLTAASCYLELCGLLDPEKDKDRIKDLTRRALKVSGQANDVKQLCAYEYLRINDRDLAKDVLLSLVVNDFNSVSNAQILSHIYSYQASLGMEEARQQHEELSHFVSKELLCAIPEAGETFDLVCSKFLICQKVQAEINTRIVLDSLVDKYARHLNRFTQTPSADASYPDEYFSDKPGFRMTRYAEIGSLISRERSLPSWDIEEIQDEYCVSMNEYANILNELVDDDEEKMIQYLDEDLSKLMKAVESKPNKPDESFFKSIQVSSMSELCNQRFLELFRERINACNTINQLSEIEDKLRALCREQGLMDYDSLYTRRQDPDLPGKPKVVLNAARDYEKIRLRKEAREKMKEACQNHADRITEGHNATLLVQGTPEYERYLRDYKSNIRTIGEDTNKLWDSNGAIAFLHLGGTYVNTIVYNRTDSDIILTEDELIKLNYKIPNFHTKYESIKCEDRILYSDYKVMPLAMNMYVNVNALYELVQELVKIRGNV